MKNNLFNIVKVIMYLFVILFFLVFMTYFKQPKGMNYQNISSFYAEKENTIDAIYYGGSASFVYFEPLRAFEKEGIAAYNYGANTIQAELYEYMINETLKYQNPELLIIDARAFQYRDKDQVPTTVSYRNLLTGTRFSVDKVKWINENVPKYLGEKADSLSSYYFDLMFYHTTEGNLIEDGLNAMLAKNANKYKGFHLMARAKRIKKEKFRTEEKKTPSKETVKILEELLNYLQTLDKDVLFIVSPYAIIESEKKVFNYVEEKVVEAGFDFVDANEYTKEMELDFDTDLYDFNHVNMFGAEKYTDFLVEYIDENYNLPDRRKEKKYNSWKKTLPQWKKDVKVTRDKINKIIEGENYDKTIAKKQ